MSSFIVKALPAIQITISILMIIAILLQNRGGGLGNAFGGGGASFHSKRGLEKTIFTATIVLAVLFVTTSILALIFR